MSPWSSFARNQVTQKSHLEGELAVTPRGPSSRARLTWERRTGHTQSFNLGCAGCKGTSPRQRPWKGLSHGPFQPSCGLTVCSCSPIFRAAPVCAALGRQKLSVLLVDIGLQGPSAVKQRVDCPVGMHAVGRTSKVLRI
uniref:Uncharacterized protein n=1 Tax=Pipistrellus kuhlii TaxID=59472 RepID=A0A7J7SVR9_PIPKU|nr:hypothetical protein mPipKuh1_009765 [Pipistrellus kuhlii]